MNEQSVSLSSEAALIMAGAAALSTRASPYAQSAESRDDRPATFCSTLARGKIKKIIQRAER
ncbi:MULTISPECIES: hypothetical protein [Methylosinus]|uniref:hypothetical protein n=1 Tax=Methylosinus TaxID=425 RepID=UPI0012DDA410|nr:MULTISPECIES: hypothetical protein [Methylosinus]